MSFIQVLFSMNAISEHLEWLKLISRKYLVSFLNVTDPVVFSKMASDDSKRIFIIIYFLDI